MAYNLTRHQLRSHVCIICTMHITIRALQSEPSRRHNKSMLTIQ
uniref:Uncharacterized protein n=1 Tax=Arundo donax TaxID=35708 RepID=A0A0A9ABV0_ARUDO